MCLDKFWYVDRKPARSYPSCTAWQITCSGLSFKPRTELWVYTWLYYRSICNPSVSPDRHAGGSLLSQSECLLTSRQRLLPTSGKLREGKSTEVLKFSISQQSRGICLSHPPCQPYPEKPENVSTSQLSWGPSSPQTSTLPVYNHKIDAQGSTETEIILELLFTRLLFKSLLQIMWHNFKSPLMKTLG